MHHTKAKQANLFRNRCYSKEETSFSLIDVVHEFLLCRIVLIEFSTLSCCHNFYHLKPNLYLYIEIEGPGEAITLSNSHINIAQIPAARL